MVPNYKFQQKQKDNQSTLLVNVTNISPFTFKKLTIALLYYITYIFINNAKYVVFT